tara:strand:- start:131 stop:271 length:141 start_codon:yes stop_codon:yes gene_type:complete
MISIIFNLNPLALTAMEFLMQEAAVFSRHTRATARSSLDALEKQGL